MEVQEEQPRRRSVRRQEQQRARDQQQSARQQQQRQNQLQQQNNSNQVQNQQRNAQVNPIHMDVEEEKENQHEENANIQNLNQVAIQQPLNPILQQQQRNQQQQDQQQQQQQSNQIFPHQQGQVIINRITPAQFIEKIPNRQILMDYFQNKCQMYCPPLRDMNKKFATDVICGNKFLLKQSQVKRISNAPNFKEFSVSNIWYSVNQHDNKEFLLKYFPDFKGKTLPSKQYLINIINTLDKGLIEKTLKDIKKRKEKQQLEQKPILITDFYMNMLQDFEALTTNQQSIGIGNILYFEQPTCNICLLEIKNNQPKKFYNCNKHKGHAHCVNQYHGSLRNNPKYLCPLRCANQNYIHVEE